jgi:hypothetical protein
MPTVQEILKQTGLSDEQITALDAKAITAFTGVLNTAEQERQQAQADRERAEVERRSNSQFYEESIAPALNSWATEKANYDGQLSYYKSQLESARAAGLEFAPPPAQARSAANGQYVSGAPGGTPGSPTFSMEAIDQRLGNGISNIGWAMQEYQKLSGGGFLPDSFDTLAEEAHNSRLPFRDYVARKYDFAGKQAEMQRKQQEEHDAKIRQDTEAQADRKWAEKIGSNPDVHIGQPSRFAEVARAVKSGSRPDPLTLNEQQRRQASRDAIRHDLAESNEAA